MWHFLGIIPFLFLSSLAIAIPSAFVSKCGALDIENNTSSTVIRDNENCRIAWVLPPTFGVINFTGFLPNGNLGLCQEVKDVQRMSSNILTRIEKLQGAIDELVTEKKQRKQEVLDAKKILYDIERAPEYQEILALEDQLVVLEKRIEDLIEKVAQCTRDCAALREELREKRQERLSIKEKIIDLKHDYFDLVRRHRVAKARLESAEESYKRVGDEIETISDNQVKLRSTLQNWLLFYSKIEGGTAYINYDTQWTENTKKLNERYRNKYQFKQVPTRNTRINANFIGAGDRESYLSSMPAVLDYAINGIKFTPWGEQGAIEQTAMPSKISGSVRLSLMGGCPMYYRNFLESDTLVRDDTASPRINFSLGATYEYPAAFKFNVTAKYNLYKLYEKVVESSSEGGFFSREQFTETIENNTEGDTFEINWHLEDDSFSYQEKQEITKALKADLVGRVLAAMATPVFSGSHMLDGVVPISTETGALVLAEGINATCGYFNLYCQGAVWVLRSLNAAFGSSTAESTFKSHHDYVAEESWSISEARWRAAATGFVGIH